MSASQDRKFFDTFMLVIGVLVAIALGLYGIARVVAGETQEQNVLQGKEMMAAIDERLAPVAKVALSGKDNSALEPAAGQAATAAAPAKDMGGEDVFNMSCVACHGTGIGGAPKFKDAAAWAPRIAKGIYTLHQHALKGFQDKGVMPAKGGRVDLSDQSVMNAVDYMVKNAK